MNPSDIQSVIERAQAAGATAADAAMSDSQATTVSVRNGEVETVEFQHDRDLHLSVYIGQRSGNANTSDLSEAGIQRAIDAAIAIAKATGEDVCNGLAPAERMATEFPDLDLNHPWDISVPEAIERAKACEAAALAVDARIKQSEGATLETRSGHQVYANSHGFVGERRGSNHYLSCSVIAQDAAGMQRDYEYSSARCADDLLAPEWIGEQASRKALARLGSRRPPTGRYPVLFRSDVARGLWGHLLSAISGGALYRKASFLLDKLGQPVCSPVVNLRQQPFIPRGSASSAFDHEGVATVERDIVAAGVLQSYALSSYSARKLGMETTGNAGGIFNLVAQPTAGDLQALQNAMGTGLLVTELMGQGVSTVTGDYSRGAAGFWIENGEIAYPVQEITIAGNLADMLASIEAIGSDQDCRGGVRSGSVWVPQMTVASAAAE